METVYRYKLEPYNGMNTRYCCPSCQKSEKTFSLYIDTETGEHIHSTVGRCNRENNCGYHYTPKQYFQENNISFDNTKPKAYKPRSVTPPPKPISYIDVDLFKASLKAHDSNHFVEFLINLFGADVANQLVERYFIGTSKYWNGSTIFWQIDTQGKIRTGKIMLYNPITGKRIKKPFNHFNWVHKALNQSEFKQCLFGEHLLTNNTMPVAIVESEKTAIIASMYLPQYIWLALGGIGLNIDKCIALKGRDVVFFPDIGAYQKWSNKAKELSTIAKFKVSDLLERKATEKERTEGLDLADFLVKFNYKDFIKSKLAFTEKPQPITSITIVEESAMPDPINYYTVYERCKSDNWTQEIAELENYFARTSLPANSLKLNSFVTIIDCSLFVNSHLATLHKYNGKRAFMPHLNRLKELKNYLMKTCKIFKPENQ